MALVLEVVYIPVSAVQAGDYTLPLAVQALEVVYRSASAAQVGPEAAYRSVPAAQVEVAVQLAWCTFRLMIGKEMHHTWGKTKRYL